MPDEEIRWYHRLHNFFWALSPLQDAWTPIR